MSSPDSPYCMHGTDEARCPHDVPMDVPCAACDRCLRMEEMS